MAVLAPRHFSADGGDGGQREQRIAPRVHCDIPLALTLYGNESESRIRDISASGAAVDSTEQVELGEVFYLRFALPGDEDGDIECAGLVRSYRRGEDATRVGLEFHKLEPEARKRIATYVHEALRGRAPGDERDRFAGVHDLGMAVVSPASGDQVAIVRWAPGLATLFQELAVQIMKKETIFVPLKTVEGLGEGDRAYLEVVPPVSHAVFRMLAEVVWIQAPSQGQGVGGLGLRLGGLSALDRHLFGALQSYFGREIGN